MHTRVRLQNERRLAQVVVAGDDGAVDNIAIIIRRNNNVVCKQGVLSCALRDAEYRRAC